MTTKRKARSVTHRERASMLELEKLAGGQITFGRLLESIRLSDEISQAATSGTPVRAKAVSARRRSIGISNSPLVVPMLLWVDVQRQGAR